MERYFDILCGDYSNDKKDIAYKKLSKYLDGKWIKDYELDEKGLLPSNLKRGVLSQDGLYNILEEYREES